MQNYKITFWNYQTRAIETQIVDERKLASYMFNKTLNMKTIDKLHDNGKYTRIYKEVYIPKNKKEEKPVE